MAIITPTLTIIANAAGAATSPGPSSSAISLSVTDTLTVDVLKASTVTPTTTHSLLFDGSAEDDGGVAGTDGGFLYLKNTSAADHDVYIGAMVDGGTAANLASADNAVRFMTLKQGEFAFFPYDYTMDITVDAENAAATLEYMLFNRA
tara:strand:- start:400 stop:843 length:444 start_codon:yes stop_codon:yes gene_type:complete